MSHLTTSIADFIQNLYVATGLLGIILAMAIESCCIPLPSEIVMPLAGVMLAGQKHLLGINPSSPLWLNIILMGLSGAIGCLIGSIAAYGIGYAGGRPLLLKYGKYVLISQHDADRADTFFQRWGAPTAFFSRLLPAVRTYISLPAGITKMPFIKFCAYTFLGSFPWCVLLAFLGYQLGNQYDKIGGPLRYVEIAVGIVLVILVVLYIWRHIRNDRLARAEHAEAEASAAAQPADMPQNNPWGQPPFQSQQQPGGPNTNRPPFQSQQQPGSQPPFQRQQQPGSQPPFQGQQQPGGPNTNRPPFQPQQQPGGQPPFQGQQQPVGPNMNRPPFQPQQQAPSQPWTQPQQPPWAQNQPPAQQQQPWTQPPAPAQQQWGQQSPPQGQPPQNSNPGNWR